MPQNDYNERKLARIKRYEERTVQADAEANQRFNAARAITRNIPMGQPILVGHHSEKHHRADLKRHDSHMDKGCEAYSKGRHYEERADAARKNRSISSDDPEAVTKLTVKIEKAKGFQKQVKDANKVIRSKGLSDDKKITQLTEMGFGPEKARECIKPDYAGRIGIPQYVMTNNLANIRRMEKRLTQLQTDVTAETTEEVYPGMCTVVENVEENRIQILFDGKPSVEIRTILKTCGFRWSPSNMAWQRMLNNAGRGHAGVVIDQLRAIDDPTD